MANEAKLLDGDLLLLLEKKLALLAQLFQLAQKQMTLINSLELDGLFDEKDACIEELRQADTVIALWHEMYNRPLSEDETEVLQSIATGLQETWDVEKKFEARMLEEKSKVALEMGHLGNRRQVRHYLGNQKSSGKNLNFRR